MEEYFGLQPTGRQFREPAANLVELTDPENLKHTAIVFDEAYRGLPELGLDIELILSFLEHPMVVGLVELSHHDLAQGVFAYPTGPAWTLRELLRIHSDLSKVVGLRAGLELAWLGGQILTEAAETGPQQGCFSHGSLSPWRIALRPDGQVQIFGYGLPHAELAARRRDPSLILDADSIRYAPPERLGGQPEELSSDTYALVLLAYEAATGRALFEGHDTRALEARITSGEASGLVAASGLPEAVAQLFADALAFDPDTRLTGRDLVDGIGALLDGALEGPSLEDLLEEVLGQRRQQPRRVARLVSTDTSAYTPEQLSSLLESSDPDPGDSPEEPRWGRVSRERRPEPATTEPAPGRRRRRRRRRDAEPPRRRRRRREEPTEEEPEQASEPQVSPAPAAPNPETPRERRARSGRDSINRLRASTSGQGRLSESGRRRRRRSEAQARPGEPPSGEPPSGEAPSGEPPSGEAPSGEPPSGEPPSGEAPSGEAPSGEARDADQLGPQSQPTEAQAALDPRAGGTATPSLDPARGARGGAQTAGEPRGTAREEPDEAQVDGAPVPKRQRLTRSGATRTSRRRRRSSTPDK